MTTICHLRRLVVLLFVMSIVCDSAVSGNPMNDFETAKQLAKQEKKDILLSFSGYRWWYPTIGIDTQTKDPWIREHFIMLEIEIPRDSDDSGGVVTAEERALIELRRMFRQEIDEPGPTILMLDADGRPYAEVDSNEQPIEMYFPDLKDGIQRRIKRDRAFRRARVANGMEKARLLNDGLIAIYEIKVDGEVGISSRQELLVDDYYEDILASISKNDPKDILGRGKELKEKKQWEKENAESSLINEKLERLTVELNQMLEAPRPLAAFFATIDKFLDSHPEMRQTALLGKVEAAIILRDYSAALKALDAMVSSEPELSATKTFNSILRPELLKAIQLASAGKECAATAYSFSLTLAMPENLLDPDGTRTLAELKRIDEVGPSLVEDRMHQLLYKVRLLLCLRDYKQALKICDDFSALGGSSKQAKLRVQELRPTILRGLNLKSSSVDDPARAEQGGGGQPATRPQSK